MNALKGWRTIILNVLAGLPPLWDTFMLAAGAFVPVAQQYSLFSYIPEKFKPIYVVVLVALNVLLRVNTTTPVGKKG